MANSLFFLSASSNIPIIFNLCVSFSFIIIPCRDMSPYWTWRHPLRPRLHNHRHPNNVTYTYDHKPNKTQTVFFIGRFCQVLPKLRLNIFYPQLSSGQIFFFWGDGTHTCAYFALCWSALSLFVPLLHAFSTTGGFGDPSSPPPTFCQTRWDS